MLDDLARECIQWASLAFVRRINREDVCRLASSFNHGRPCHLAGEPKQGSFNVCFPVIFDAHAAADLPENEQNQPQKMMVRFPIMPRVAFPAEKLRGEIATMKYVAQHTTIPLPRIHGYGFGGDYPTGLPFLLLEYVEGRRLGDTKYSELDPPSKAKIYRQLADMFIQLREQEFDHIGSLTLDRHGAPIFSTNRPMGINFCDAQLDGQDPARLLGPNDIFTSTTAYVRFLLHFAYNNFLRQRDAVEDMENARFQIYALHEMRDRVRAWIDPGLDSGPFVLMHGDLLPGNIIVDDDFNVLAIIDWEWSHTVPLQLFVPPSWLTGVPVEFLTYEDRTGAISEEWSCLAGAVHETELKRPTQVVGRPRVSELWADVDAGKLDAFLLAHSLLRLDSLVGLYHRRFYSRSANHLERLNRFFDPPCDPVGEDHLLLAARKVEQRKQVRVITDDFDRNFEAIKRPRSPMPVMDKDDTRCLTTYVRGFDRAGRWAGVASLYNVSKGWFLSQSSSLSLPYVITSLNQIAS
ncbi:MAG: hypothetical protein M1832_006357 [Thelocarpon impressellum]|nr:MAG: hypothetical protein M1832_006357 [Thelocarpon impressellum]